MFFLTHNVSLFNLLSYYDNNFTIDEKKFNWEQYHFYELNGEATGYSYPGPYKVKDLEDLLKSEIKADHSLDDIGNKIRKQVEMTVHQISQLLLKGVNGLLPLNKLLDSLKRDDFQCYDKNKFKFLTANEIIGEIEDILSSGNPNKIKNIEQHINDWKYKTDQIRNWLSQLALLQKLSLHPMSHSAQLVGYSEKELELAIGLLKNLDTIISISNKEFPTIA